MSPKELPAVQDAIAPEGILFRLSRMEKTGCSMGGLATLGGAAIYLIVFGGLAIVALAYCGLSLFFIAGLFQGAQEGNLSGQGIMTVVGVVGFLVFSIVVGGAFFIAVAVGLNKLIKKVGYGNVDRAEDVVKSGTIRLDEVIRRLSAREPSQAERQTFTGALSKLNLSSDSLFFDGWYLIPSSLPVMLAFGSHLFLSREALDDPDFQYALAHEMGSLNLGLSFVKPALWELGKGFFRENVSLFGTVTANDKDFDQADLVYLGLSVTKDIVAKSRTGTFLDVLIWGMVTATKGTGASVQKAQLDIKAYFQKWDIESDKRAMNMVVPQAYAAYLKQIAEFENRTGTPPFNAPAEIRLENVMANMLPPSLPSSAPSSIP
jgi:hypothetical protein